jgi:hypothetical protein
LKKTEIESFHTKHGEPQELTKGEHLIRAEVLPMIRLILVALFSSDDLNAATQKLENQRSSNFYSDRYLANEDEVFNEVQN